MKVIAIIGASVLCLSGCVNLTEADEKCGPEKQWESVLTFRNGNILGSTRKVTLETETEPDDICTVEHIKPTFLILRHPDIEIPESFRFLVSANAPAFTGSTEFMERTPEGDLKGTVDFGLTQAYGDKAGYVNLKIIVEFPSTSPDWSIDSTYLASIIIVASAKLDYREHKDR